MRIPGSGFEKIRETNTSIITKHRHYFLIFI